jgi:hypothetical protein
MVFSKVAGSLSAIWKPPSPILFSGLALAFLSYSTSSRYYLWLIVVAPSSATLLAAPGSSISRLISYESSDLGSCATLRPSFLSSSACFFFSAGLILLNFLSSSYDFKFSNYSTFLFFIACIAASLRSASVSASYAFFESFS